MVLGEIIDNGWLNRNDARGKNINAEYELTRCMKQRYYYCVTSLAEFILSLTKDSIYRSLFLIIKVTNSPTIFNISYSTTQRSPAPG
jgi:hypothetical protein